MTNTVLTDWFGLKTDRGGFKATLDEDASRLLGDPNWQKEVEDIFEESELLDEPIRIVWWGDYGIGKTHRLLFMDHLIKSQDKPYLVARCVCSDIDEKTPFSMLLEKIMLSIRYERLQPIVRSFFQSHGRDEALKRVQSWVENPDIAVAYSCFDDSNEEGSALKKAWNFLLGRALDGKEHEDIKVTKKKLEHSHEFVDVIKVFSRILHSENKKRLLIMVDEGENLARLKRTVSETKWREPLRYLLEDSFTGLVMTVGAAAMEEIPEVFGSPDIIRRIQEDNYKHIEAISDISNVKHFIEGLLDLVVDQTKLQELKKSGELATSSGFNDQLYPFESDATFDDFCQIITDIPANAKPSVIMHKMQRLAIAAKQDNSRLITNLHLSTIA